MDDSPHQILACVRDPLTTTHEFLSSTADSSEAPSVLSLGLFAKLDNSDPNRFHRTLADVRHRKLLLRTLVPEF